MDNESKLEKDPQPQNLEIVLWPDERLKTKCSPVLECQFGSFELRQQLVDMIFTMYANNGIGLAANQVGFSNRVIIISKNPTKELSLPLVLINPMITKRSDKTQTITEGCLSFPDKTNPRRRPKKITVKAKNFEGNEFTWKSQYLQAQCIQHEIDHINGKNFLER